MKSRAADDDDGEDDGEEEEEGEEGDVTESCSPRRGAHERNGAASTFRSRLKASADQGSKSRQSMNSLKEIICNTLSYQNPPNAAPNAGGAAGAGAGAASSLRKGELSAASFDDCVR